MQVECLSTENEHFDEGQSGCCVHKARVIAQVINMTFRNGARFFAVSHYAPENNVLLCSTMNVMQLVVNSSEPYFRMLKRLFTKEPMLIVIGRSDIVRL